MWFYCHNNFLSTINIEANNMKKKKKAHITRSDVSDEDFV